jgi:aryl-alcohol dehydrogenase-like predicted oxidoreductase
VREAQYQAAHLRHIRTHRAHPASPSGLSYFPPVGKCGGFLADTWLDRPEPDPYSSALTPSQRKYLDAITRVWGDWALFQRLLTVLRRIGDRHGGASIANIAVRWVLDHPFVGAVLVGTRLGVSEHPEDNLNVFRFRLSDADRTDIEAVLERSNGRKMITLIGDCGAEYR